MASFGTAVEYFFTDFSVGDIVKLKTGTAKLRVLEIRGHALRCEYLSSRKQIGFRDKKDYIMYPDNTFNNTTTNYIDTTAINSCFIEEKKENKMLNKLYQTLDGKRFGTFLTEDGDGNFVLKMSDSSGYEAFDKIAVKRVMPYTVDIQFVGSDRVYSYKAKEGQFTVGDMLITNALTLASVVAVNTESEGASKEFTGKKLVTAEVS